jgi:hypothetical protein
MQSQSFKLAIEINPEKGVFHVSEESPKYWGKWEGDVIKTLVLHDNEFVNFNILEAKTKLTPKGLKMALFRLHKENIIHYDGKRYVLVNDDIKKEYKIFLEKKLTKDNEQKELTRQNPQKIKPIPEDTILTQNEANRITGILESTKVPVKEEKDFRKAFPANYLCNDGHNVRSISEALIDNWLYEHDIAHAYERKVPIEEEMYCDFYIKRCNCYVEFWGLEDKKYGNRKAKKIELYEKYTIRLIQLNSEDIKRLDDVFPQRLRKFGINVQ